VAALRDLGGLDSLVVNAVRWPTQNTSASRISRRRSGVPRANIEGAFAVIQAALTALRASRRGRIDLAYTTFGGVKIVIATDDLDNARVALE
jgi:NAD(P)-dependent dehydrogenase (short-subunit alcohol dehydrogenase family)